jgi:hypothetical protein
VRLENMWVKAAMRKPGSDCAVFLLLAFWSVMTAGCGERENILVIEKPTEVHAITQAASAPDPGMNIQLGKIIATLKSGETAKAIGVYHGQGYDGFKVKLVDGTEGIIIAGDTFTVTSR